MKTMLIELTLPECVELATAAKLAGEQLKLGNGPRASLERAIDKLTVALGHEGARRAAAGLEPLTPAEIKALEPTPAVKAEAARLRPLS